MSVMYIHIDGHKRDLMIFIKIFFEQQFWARVLI